MSWNRAFGVKAANNLVFSDQYYRAIFGPQNLPASLGTFPTTVIMGDGTFFETGNAFGSSLGGDNGIWPQGRNVTGYQAVDDFSYNLSSKHTLKLGLYFHRNLVSDHDYGLESSGLLIPLSIADLFAGAGTQVGAEFIKNFPTALEQNIKLYQLGWYVQDEWKPTSSLKLTLALRADHNSNPVCAANCFARLSSSFATLDHDPTVPYNQAVESGIGQAMPSFTKVAWQPRFGFSYAPTYIKNTVFRGGIGVFMDTFPGQIADNLSQNIPVFNGFTGFYPGSLLQPQICPPANPNCLFGTYQAFAQGQGAIAGLGTAGNGYDTLAGANTALIQGFSSGGTLSSITTADPLFVPPNFNTAEAIHAPITYEWNFMIQHAIGNNTSFSLNYVGNHGTHQTVLNNGVNGFCPAPVCPNGFAGLPATQPDSRFLTVTEIQTVANSNYNGLSASFQHRFQRGLQFQVNYSYSHALDEISNGGFNGFGGQSILAPQIPGNLRAFNYGNADYDTRHYVSANYVYEIPKGPTPFLKGWQLSGTLFARSGLPFSVVNSGVTDTLSGFGFGGPALATYSGTSFAKCSGPGGTEDGGFNP